MFVFELSTKMFVLKIFMTSSSATKSVLKNSFVLFIARFVFVLFFLFLYLGPKLAFNIDNSTQEKIVKSTLITCNHALGGRL